ncbi:hypothetical protein EDD18DRAFT_1366034 [Armillaria luteobubalina]|uniref:Mon2 C-terminal domain-containing protein n=1 Tax=Armillaria luteobubalina TaxID=153913 RepID=A0AA39P4C4_9AGAR|nr:hypothetical protein EDD18DRAFT_1366034 [Armillaria luteobubalina]
MFLFLQIFGICTDLRPEVRDGAIQTLFSMTELHGGTLSLETQDRCIWKVTFPRLDSLSGDIRRHSSEEEGVSPSDHAGDASKSLALQSVGSIFRDFLASKTLHSKSLKEGVLDVFRFDFIDAHYNDLQYHPLLHHLNILHVELCVPHDILTAIDIVLDALCSTSSLPPSTTTTSVASTTSQTDHTTSSPSVTSTSDESRTTPLTTIVPPSPASSPPLIFGIATTTVVFTALVVGAEFTNRGGNGMLSRLLDVEFEDTTHRQCRDLPNVPGSTPPPSSPPSEPSSYTTAIVSTSVPLHVINILHPVDILGPYAFVLTPATAITDSSDGPQYPTSPAPPTPIATPSATYVPLAG